MQMQSNISLLIPTMNRPDSLKRTLLSYCQAEVIPSQIVIVDQSQSMEHSLRNKCLIDDISREYCAEILYLYQKEPSLTKARNTAIKHAKHDIIICSDDDIDVYNDTLKNVIQIMADNNVAMIGGLNDNAGNSRSIIGYILGTKSFIKRNIGHVTKSVLGRYPKQVKGYVSTEWAMGYFFVIRKSLLVKWNVFWDENLTSYAYGEDLDFSHRYYLNANESGYNCILSEIVRVKHVVSQEYRIPSQKDTYMYVINRAYISHKWSCGFDVRLAMGWTNFWIVLLRFFKKENPKDMIKAIKYLRNNKDSIYSGKLYYGE